jgi:hypothetical protein
MCEPHTSPGSLVVSRSLTLPGAGGTVCEEKVGWWALASQLRCSELKEAAGSLWMLQPILAFPQEHLET